jgi:hypothetical protein
MTALPVSATSKDLHAEVAAKYRELCVREFDGLSNDPRELRDTLCLLGASLMQMSGDVAILHLRKREWDRMVAFAGVGIAAGAPQDIADGRRLFLKEEFERLAAFGSQPYVPHMLSPPTEANECAVAVRALVSTGGEPQRTEFLLSSVRSAIRNELEARAAVGELAWVADEIQYLEGRIEKLREIAAMQEPWRSKLEERTAKVNKAREELEAIERQVVIEWACLSIDKVSRDDADQVAGIELRRCPNVQEVELPVGA